ncbi:MAG: DUF192 domain-containing protein [Roseibium album]|uniref:DUF192 domain-containing protein n=1 Tax=Roseibium album TaxID=311410 RepID=UPI0032EE6768
MLQTFVRLFLIVVLVIGPSVTALAQGEPQQLRQEELTVRSGDTEHRFLVEIAATDRERSRGLMFREEMAADHGMLFIFDSEGERYFWMKNTPLPLDIIYIGANGAIVSIAANTVPFSEKVVPSGDPAKYVLELNAGTAAKLGMDVGNEVSSPSMIIE